jgi:hypothetical protein
MKRSGSADLPLHYGYVPKWLAERMAKLGLAITESIITEYGKDAFLQKMSDPFWFQSLGAVMGMDWHSSGITTSVMGALKKVINPNAKALGIYICGGKGKFSKETPAELLKIANATGLNGNELVHSSKLSAKVDNTAVQDGFQLYTHNFILSDNGNWSVIQQGMNAGNKTARRYHWHSDNIQSFTEEPHTGICGINQGTILNLTAKEAAAVKQNILQFTAEEPSILIKEFQQLIMPAHHYVKAEDVNLKRLGSMLWLAHDRSPKDFEELLLLEGVGPRTIQSLTLVSEVIHGTPSRFKDPARFSFAHGGKDGHPFPVPTKVYDETISTLQTAVHKAKLGNNEKSEAIKKLHTIAAKAEKDFIAEQTNFDALIEKERSESWKHGGKTVHGDAKPPKELQQPTQLKLF